MSQNRDYFRIVFPIGERPCLKADLTEWDILDLSENGARVAVNDDNTLRSLDSFDATIRFSDGTAATVNACVQRREAEGVVLQFREQLAYSLIMAEQRRLLRLYPREKLI